jgi:2,3-dihydroxybenzoate-AMP ligase
MLEGVVPFPPEFAARYRERGYWEDRSIADQLRERFVRYADRAAVIDGERTLTYAQLDAASTRLALNLLDLGLRPLDRVVVQLPNVLEFVVLYCALQKLGAIPIAALPSHRYHEVSQFVRLAGAVACVAPDRHGDFAFAPLIERLRAESPGLRHGILLGEAPAGFHALQDLIERRSPRDPAELERIAIDPTDPAVFQLSGGTTGVPKLIPRTHNDYIYNSKLAAQVTGVRPDSCVLIVVPIAHNLALACPGVQGYLLHGGRIVLSTSTRGADVFPLIERHRVTHVKVVPALLIRWLNDPLLQQFDLSSLEVIQSGGQRLQPEIRLRARALIPGVFVQENFGMAEGLLMFVRRDDPEEVQLETVGRPVSPDDEVRLVDDEDHEVPDGEVGELLARGPYTLRGYFGVPEYNARAFTTDGFYRSGDLMRRHPSGAYIVEGRKKDLINRGGEKISAEEVENLILQHPAVLNVACVPMPDPVLGERMCAYVIPRGARAAEATLTLADLTRFLLERGLAKFKLPERLELVDEFPLSAFGKVSKKDLAARIAAQVAAERAGQGAGAS